MRKLKHAEVKILRENWWEAQGKRCALCQQALRKDQAVLDHDHHTGVCRGVLHRGCNSLLGKVENNASRYGVSEAMLSAFLHGAATYLQEHRTPRSNFIHPTYRTPDEKRLRRNAKARARRAKEKKA